MIIETIDSKNLLEKLGRRKFDSRRMESILMRECEHSKRHERVYSKKRTSEDVLLDYLREYGSRTFFRDY